MVTLGIWIAVCAGGVMSWDWLWRHRWEGAAGALTLGLLASGTVVLSAPSGGDGLLGELYLGRRVNPQLFDGDRHLLANGF